MPKSRAKTGKDDQDISPIRKQYLEIKKEYPNAILFFRLGDFYETFDQDAEITSRELDIVLTSRNVAKGHRVPMAGIPHHAVENYLGRLIERGHHVAICEQVGETPIRGIFQRKVVRVVTAGTIQEPGLLPGDANNYLASFVISGNQLGLAYADISTGEFAATEIIADDIHSAIRAELSRIHPAEILFPDTEPPDNGFPGHQTPVAPWRFEKSRCQEVMKSHFHVLSLDGFGLRGHASAIQAAGSILQYLEETQSKALKLFQSIHFYRMDEFMTLDGATRRNLELTETIRESGTVGSLLSILDYSISPQGRRLIRQWVNKPLLKIAEIQCRQDGVEYFFHQGLVRKEFREHLKPLVDIERVTNRIISGTANPRDLVALRSTLRQLPGCVQIFQDCPTEISDRLANLNPCADELNLLENALTDDPPGSIGQIGIFREEFSDQLDQVKESTKHARLWISQLESIERERTGIKSLKVRYNKVFGYYIEITKSNAGLAPKEYIRKQTLVNAERYITPEMKEYEALVLNAEERIREIERRLFTELCERLARSAGRLLLTSKAIAELDVLAALAETAVIHGYIRPVITEDQVLDIRDGRHPVVEKTLIGERFVPNDTVFQEGENVRIITGPNMSGKSTFLRQVALIVLMAQVGSFVPSSSAKIGLVDRIFTRIGAQDEIHAGQSTFMVEMVETANILHHATPRSLLILDEIGRGTSTYDGVSIAWAVVEYIHNHPGIRAKTLFATHYHELTQLADLLPGVKNFSVAVSEADGKVVFLHKIVPGGADRSYGIHVGQLAGLPMPVIQRAGEILKQLEVSSGSAVRVDPQVPKQMVLFPDTNPLLDELEHLDINTLSPIEALNKLYEWQKKFLEEKKV